MRTCVNGKYVECSPAEEAAILAEWAAADALPPPEPKPTLDDVIAVLRSDTSLSEKLDARVSAADAQTVIAKE